MSDQAFQEALSDVATRFRTVDALLATTEFDRRQKIKLLQQWEHDLRLMMVATEENMGNQTGRTPQGSSAETFRAVRHALDELDAPKKPDGASKLG